MSEEVRRAAQILRRGGLVAFPTETVYGLGADASSEAALKRLYAVKRRPSDHPVIVHFARAEDAFAWAREVPEAARRLAARFWPGPLTLILKRAAYVGDFVTGGQDTVGLRVPSHPVAHELLVTFGGGVKCQVSKRASLRVEFRDFFTQFPKKVIARKTFVGRFGTGHFSPVPRLWRLIIH